MKILLRKYFLFMLMLVHLAAAVGYAGIVHHCLEQHHAPAAQTACCCSANQPEAAASCCSVDQTHSLPDTEDDRLMLINSTCCELISLYHRIEESGPLASAALIHAVAAPISLLPHVKEFSLGSLYHTLTPIAANQLNLPLLI